MLAEFRSVFADFGRPDQDVKRAAEPAALSGNDLVMHPLLRRAHLIRGSLAITAHSLALLLEARQDNQAVSQPLCCGPQARLRRINRPESALKAWAAIVLGKRPAALRARRLIASAQQEILDDATSGGFLPPALVKEGAGRRPGIWARRYARRIAAGLGAEPARGQSRYHGANLGRAAAELRAAGQKGVARRCQYLGHREARLGADLGADARGIPRRRAV